MYYRLKQIDGDGRYTYSPITTVHKAPSKILSLSVYPNPFENNYTLSFHASVNEKATVMMLDLQGRIMTTMNTDIIKGENNLQVNGLSKLEAGVYFVKLKIANEMQVVKVVKY